MLSFLPCRLFLNEICKILVYVSIAKKFRESNKTNRRGIRPAYNWYCSSTDRSNTDTFFRAIHIRRTFLCWSHLRTNLYLHWQISKHLVVCLLSSYLAKWTSYYIIACILLIQSKEYCLMYLKLLTFFECFHTNNSW